MRGPKPPMIELAPATRQGLEAFVRRHNAPQQLVVRARVVLGAADGANNAQLARQLGVSLDLVRLWRNRWLGLAALPLDELSIEERLSDVPRPGRPARISAAQLCQITALACEAPRQSGRPISQWTSREIAAEVQQRGIVDKISPRHAARVLKRGTLNRT